MKLIVPILLISFAFGLWNTQRVLRKDIEIATFTSGRVNLLYSYFYELYNPREVLTWWVATHNAPIVPLVVDKAALMVYGKFLGLRCGRSRWVLTGYGGGKRIDPFGGYWGIYDTK